MGINIPTKEELIANKPEFQNIAGYIGEFPHNHICFILSVLHSSARNCSAFAGADSVQYLSVEGLVSAVQEGIGSMQSDKVISSNTTSKRSGHCTACLTGKYPVELEW